MPVNIAEHVQLSLPDPGTTPDQVLERMTAHVREHGLAGASYRKLAEVAGVRPRTLQYYFGTREVVLGYVLEALREDDISQMLAAAPSLRDGLQRLWDHYTGTESQLQIRLFFHLAGLAAEDPSTPVGTVAQAVGTWDTAVTALLVRDGVDERRARPQAHLLMAAFRGLLLSRVLTDDAEADNAAIAVLLDTLVPREADDRSRSVGQRPTRT
jgi:AcrR family transcriptional regulator